MLDEECSLCGNVVYAYTRHQAMEDEVLVDVSKMAKEVGFIIEVAVTCAVWDDYISWTDKDSARQTSQDESGRLWDVLWMLSLACQRSKDESCIHYDLNVIPCDGKAKSPVQVTLKAIIGVGDAGEPVITIMLPDED